MTALSRTMPPQTSVALSKKEKGGSSAPIVSLEIRAPKLPQMTPSFVQLRTLVQRLVQDAFNELQMMVDSISSIGMSSEEKKSRIVKYALDTRKQFIKLLVLEAWSHDAPSVTELINIKTWLDSESTVCTRTVELLMLTRKLTSAARIRNPDLETAIEILSTGRPQTAMMKRYVPPPELTSADILKICHNLNAQLSIRLGLHENIPPYFRGYKIASGRATFTAKDEFEVDLSISDDNPKSQFYVIDVRPIYEPAIRPLPQSILKTLELQGNHVLFERGLEGIFDYLHNYFLTTKIETLHRQVSEMRWGRWTENLHITQHKRTLVIQYWPQRSGEQKSMEKSWIEVGIKRGIKGGPSRLGARWVREGQEMKDIEVPLDVANLSAEELVKTTISMHTKHILKTLQLKLYSIPLFKTPGTVTFVQHPTDSLETYLRIQLTPSKECKVLIEPITGRFAIQKPSEKAAKLEMDINNSPIARAAEYVSRFRGLVLQEEVEQRARSMGWDVLKFLQLRKEELKPHFPTNTQYLLYIRRRGWLPNWVIAFVLSDTGESWWATQIEEKPLGWTISIALRIPTKGDMNVTYRFLENLEKMAAGFISLYVNHLELESRNVQHRFAPSKVVGSSYTSPIQLPDLYFRSESFIKAARGVVNVLQISFQGLAEADGQCTIICMGRTNEPMTQISSTPLSTDESDVSFHPQSGSYAIRFIIRVGESIIPQVIEKLHRIECLISFVTVIRKFQLNCTHVSLGRVVFRYSDDPAHTAEISFTGEMEMKLILPEGSPHNRMKTLLQKTLNEKNQTAESNETTGLATVIKTLIATLPLMIEFNAIEYSLPKTTTVDDFTILIRGIDGFRMEYKNKKSTIDIRLQNRRSMMYWYFTDPAASGNCFLAPDGKVCAQLKEIWMGEGVGWHGLKNGAAAKLAGTRDLVRKCHELIWGKSGSQRAVE